MKIHQLVLLTGLAFTGFSYANHHEGHNKRGGDMYDGAMQERWKLADKDGDGYLSKAEVESGDMPRLVRDFEKLDKNKDGKLSHEETEARMKKKTSFKLSFLTRRIVCAGSDLLLGFFFIYAL